MNLKSRAYVLCIYIYIIYMILRDGKNEIEVIMKYKKIENMSERGACAP